MMIPATVLADLQLLDEVLEGASPDTRGMLAVLTSEAAHAVSSYLGLSVVILTDDEAALEITTLLSESSAEPIGASLRFDVRGDSSSSSEEPALIELILYAAQPGAFVDLAADLTWLTARPWRDVRVDQDLVGPQEGAQTRSLSAWSTLNQARGVLLSRGRTREEADSVLDARATATGVDRHRAAAELLAEVSSGGQPSTW